MLLPARTTTAKGRSRAVRTRDVSGLDLVGRDHSGRGHLEWELDQEQGEQGGEQDQDWDHLVEDRSGRRRWT